MLKNGLEAPLRRAVSVPESFPRLSYTRTVSFFHVVSRVARIICSRRYRTGSPRSDVDILVELAHGARIRPQELWTFSSEHCPALDLFLTDGGKAVSCANESCVQAESLSALVSRLEAICFWTRAAGALTADIDWHLRVPLAVDFEPTALLTDEPVSGKWLRSFRAHVREVAAAGLPTQPYIASTATEVAAFLVDTLRRLVTASSDLSPKGKGWENTLRVRIRFSEPVLSCIQTLASGTH
jgi:hypothetical protein